MNDVGLAMFVKTPSLSPVKTRLWPRIGQRHAEAFHLASAEAVASVVQRVQTQAPLHAYWAVAEARGMQGDFWADLPRLPQGEGGLGERMRHVHRQLLTHHAAALLIGADAPQLTAESLLKAVHWLSHDDARIVIGRAVDGGFWLFGSNRLLPAEAWTDVCYSMPHTARDFFARMQPHGASLELEILDDVDHYEDLPRVQQQLRALSSATDAQQRLRMWIEDVLSGGER